jgi:phosphopantothenoylcysteine decarboxylase/phosphopantothenate--cysteine ligase
LPKYSQRYPKAGVDLNIVLGVGGGIAAYKVASLLRLLKEAGHDVHVVPTQAALNFVGQATWESLSGHPVTSEVWHDVSGVPHVALGQNADLILVAPATADLISRTASGAANDLLTNILLTARCPIVFAPAMHTEMWENSATVENVATLRSRGITVIDPEVGRLTGADTGPGRLPDVEQIAQIALAQGIKTEKDLTGKKFLITAGGTREYIDPVRFIGNRSSGKQGVALAVAARDRGAQVTLICANISVTPPSGVQLINVETSVELSDAVRSQSKKADVIIMAAAVADFTPSNYSETKIKKTEDKLVPDIELKRTEDILQSLVATKSPGQYIVGFAAETGDSHASVVEHGLAKLNRKNCDLLVVNEVGRNKGFGTDENAVVILAKDAQSSIEVPSSSKNVIAGEVLNVIAKAIR